MNPHLTHVRENPEVHGSASKTLCGISSKNIQSLSYRHVVLGYAVSVDTVLTQPSSGAVSIDRSGAIRDGIETIPEPLCRACVTSFLGAHPSLAYAMGNVEGGAVPLFRGGHAGGGKTEIVHGCSRCGQSMMECVYTQCGRTRR